MKSTSLGSSEVSMPARSPGLSSTGPLVSLKPTPSSLAMMLLRVVLPSPGGPCSRVWSSGSPRNLAASTNTSRFSTTFCWPLKSLKRSGLRAFSNSFSADDSVLLRMSKSLSVIMSGDCLSGAKLRKIWQKAICTAQFHTRLIWLIWPIGLISLMSLIGPMSRMSRISRMSSLQLTVFRFPKGRKLQCKRRPFTS